MTYNKLINVSGVKLLLKEINVKKAVNVDTVLLKLIQILVKLGTDILGEHLTMVMNFYFRAVFATVVIPLDKPITI